VLSLSRTAVRIPRMKYMAVTWLHENSIDPIELFSELDVSRYEVRKVEVFSDGRLGYADSEHESLDTRISIEAVPSIEEILADPQFEARAISSNEFEQIWSRAVSQGQR
jgi:hypothetical protein